MYSNNRIRIIRYVLFPIALIYGAVIYVRNFLFDKNILKSKRFNFPIICIGNLSVGGTGKTPMTEMLINHLKENFNLATLSRGYKRKTKGFLIAKHNTTAKDIGDEPMQFHTHFPNIVVAVGEDRCSAIEQLLTRYPQLDTIILDDAMQHRKVAASCNILLTDYNNLFTEDYFLPVGSLRDQRSSCKRANILIVTKCPPELSLAESKEIIAKINPTPKQSVFFSTIVYGTPYNLFSHEYLELNEPAEIIAVAGIANPRPYFDHLKKHYSCVQEMALNDHQEITEKEIDKIFFPYKMRENKKNLIFMITEKDAPRFLLLREMIFGLSKSVYVLPIKSEILLGEVGVFYEKINSIITNGKIK